METIFETIGKCPIGLLVKETKIDIFGFVFESKLRKYVRRDWKLFSVWGDDKGFSYSDHKFYYPNEELVEAI